MAGIPVGPTAFPTLGTGTPPALSAGGRWGSRATPHIHHAHARGAGAAPTWTRGPASPHLSSLGGGHPAPAKPLGDSSNLGERIHPDQHPRWGWRPTVRTPRPALGRAGAVLHPAHLVGTVCRAGLHPGTVSGPGRLRARRGMGATDWPVRSPGGWCCLTCGWRRTWGHEQQGTEAPAAPSGSSLHSANGRDDDGVGGPSVLPATLRPEVDSL